jgi:ATP-dependent RNA helicase RhlE
MSSLSSVQSTSPSTSPDFEALGLIDPLVRAVRAEGYTDPTPIQSQAIPLLLEGRDLLGCARTGTGKTAAFALPILQHLAGAGRPARAHTVRCLVLVPTRELAQQVSESFRRYGQGVRLSVATVHGGVGQTPQVRALVRGVDVLVATPGRLLDLLGQGHAHLDRVEVLVLDEADHMLDLGFIPDVRRLVAELPRKRQTLLFSATMPAPIAELAKSLLHDPARIFVTPTATPAEAILQSVHFVQSSAKPEFLTKLLGAPEFERTLVFTRTKRGADRIAERLTRSGIGADAIHGNKSQNARDRALASFKAGRTRVLVATDLAARGIDVDGITHVINYELPDVPETYVHRIGRTARAGAAGIAISLCDSEERGSLRGIEKLIKRAVPLASGSAEARVSGHARVERRTGSQARPQSRTRRPQQRRA